MPTTPRPQVPLEIKFIDSIRPVKMGRELRFEVTRTDRPTERVSFDQLDFAFAPVMWGVVGPGAEPGTGVVKVVALAKSRDVYDKPKYEMTATYKARGDTSLEAGNLFALAIAAPVVEIRFFMREDDPSTEDVEYEQFDPQAQSTPLQSSDLSVDPPGVADLFEQDGKFYARIHDPRRAGRLTVTFPNGEKAEIPLDVLLAGKRPEELARLAAPGGDGDEPPPDAVATVPRHAPAPFSVIPGGLAGAGRSAAVTGEETELAAPEPPSAPAPVRHASRADAAAQSAAMPSAASMPSVVPSAGATAPPSTSSGAPSTTALPGPASAPPSQSSGGASARPTSLGTSVPPPGSKVDPSYTLRSNMVQLRREIDAALGDGLIPTGARGRLQARVAFFRDAAKHYKGPDFASVQEFFDRTLGDVKLEG